MKRGTTDRKDESINGGTNDRMNKTMNKRIHVFVLLTRRTPMFKNEIKDGREAL